MTKRIEVAPAPAALEAYVKHFDPVFGKSNQREGFRRYVEGLLLASERHKTLTGLVNTEPVVGAQLPRAQKLQWFLSESDWGERKVQAERLKLLREDAITTHSEPTSPATPIVILTGGCTMELPFCVDCRLVCCARLLRAHRALCGP